jgi:uncharacterized protein involved in outer membrane biogenesis
MKFLQQSIEKRLSNLLGAKVTFGRLKISALSGRLEAENMIVAGDTPDQPLLTIRGIEAQIAVAKALAGQIVVKSLVIEGPEIFLIRREDGSLNVPKRPVRFASDAPKESTDESAGWQFEAQSILVRDGRIRFQRDSKVAGVEAINCELKCQDGQIDMAAIELRGTVEMNDWLPVLPPGLANVRMEITLPLATIFPNRKG